MEVISSKLDNNTILSGVKFLGTQVRAPGKEIVKQDSNISQVTYTLDGNSIRTYVNIFDRHGNIVNTVELGPKSEGTYDFKWDGKDFNGNILPDGHYFLSFGAEGDNGEGILVNSEVYGKVVGITKDGTSLVLRLDDGREVPMDTVDSVGSFDN